MAKKIKANSAQTFSGLQRKNESTEFNPDYTNVKRDLKRIGILAGSLFGAMIVLAFLLN